MLTRSLLVFASSAVMLFFFFVWRLGTGGAVTGRVLLLMFEEATAIAFIPAALYVVYRLVRH